MSEGETTPSGSGGTSDTPGVRVVRGVVAAGTALVDCVIEPGGEPGTFRVDLVVNGGSVCSATVATDGAAETPLQLGAPVTALPDLLESIEVQAHGPGRQLPVTYEDGFLLGRTIVRTIDEFENRVMRKHLRVRDRETVCFAARQALRRFPGDLRTSAVSLAVIGYRIAENPDGVNEDLLAELTAAADRLIESIDGTVAAQARWASSLNVMMFNVYATLRRPRPAIKYLMQLFSDRQLVYVEPMCAFNCMIGIVALGYIYRLQKRPDDATAIWSEAGKIFGTSAMNMPKTFGAICEFEFIQTCAKLCVTGIAEIAGSRDRRMLQYTEADVAALCLRAATKKGVRRTAAFFVDVKADPELLPPAEVALAYRY